MANNNQQIPIGIVAPAVKGDWLSAMTYNVLNIVRHNNATYMSKVKNVGIEPGASTSWENTWALLVQDGENGQNGNGIVSIEQTGVSDDTLTVTYTILFTDGSSTTFDVKNGNGIKSVEKRGTDGLVDTYAILFTDGTSTTFLITNGKNGETGNGISSITLASTQGLVKTYDINFTNGTKTQFSVSDGERGDAGNGISNIELTSTNGLEKTYTIYFTDGNTTTFVVTDGEGVPAGGDEGDVLVKNSSTNYDGVWVPQSQLSVGNDQYGNNIANSYANALKGTVSGIGVAITDVSPIEHELGVKVERKNLFNPQLLLDNGYTVQSDGTYQGTTARQFVCFTNTSGRKGAFTISVIAKNVATGLSANALTFLAKYTDGTSEYKASLRYATTGYQDITGTTNANKTVSEILFSYSAKAEINIKQIQIEYGSSATQYVPYVSDISSVTVSEYGKNLFNNDLSEIKGIYIPTLAESKFGQSLYFPVIPETYYTISARIPIEFANGISLSGVLESQDGIIKSQFSLINNEVMSPNTFLLEPGDTLYLYDESGSTLTHAQALFEMAYIQLEVGNSATQFVPFEKKTFSQEEVGTINGIYSIYPTTTLIPSNNGALLTVEYNKDLNKAFAELYNAIISLGGNV